MTSSNSQILKGKKILVFTDSRGEYRIASNEKPLFWQRMAADGANLDAYICPFKWTTIVDFLELANHVDLSEYDFVILFAGIVDWSPRPISVAVNKIYANNAPIATRARPNHLVGYANKIENNKKGMFDALIGEQHMKDHFDRHYAEIYEGEFTTSMYDLDIGAKIIAQKLAGIPNLIFINSNRFVPGWEGNYFRSRPANIAVTEEYARIFFEIIGSPRCINILDWDYAAVTDLTVDNIHLSDLGHKWIYSAIIANIVDRCSQSNKLPQEQCYIDRNNDIVRLMAFHESHRDRTSTESYSDKLATLAGSNHRIFLNPSTSDINYLNDISFLLDDDEILHVAQRSEYIKSKEYLDFLALRLFANAEFARTYISNKFNIYMHRNASEYDFIRASKYKHFPYNYLSDYCYKAEPATRASADVSIEFIYCIKNRRERTAVSVRSLVDSLQAYKRRVANGLDLRILIVEDISEDIFDPNMIGDSCVVRHLIVDTGKSWTRSGLLNVGIRNSTADIIAFVDSDFLFHREFVTELSRFVEEADWKRSIIACNLFETECHRRSEKIYSELSPYSYMWLVPRLSATFVMGFDEGYEGHGSEDRDFELKMRRLGGLNVVDTASIRPGCMVLHLSHEVRDGFSHHIGNRQRFRDRALCEDPQALLQTSWGNFDLVWSCESRATTHKSRIQIRIDIDLHNEGQSLSIGDRWAPRKLRQVAIPAQSAGRNDSSILHMIISCRSNGSRIEMLTRHYSRRDLSTCNYVFVVGGSDNNYFDPMKRILYLKVGDHYEDLPEKVLKAFMYCHQYWKFSHVLKVDDDVVVNFDLMHELIRQSGHDYFGKMIPSRRGAKPSPTWHIGKVSNRSRFFDKPFNFEGGPEHWCCGGAYVLSSVAVSKLSALAMSVDPTKYLYEDHMIGSLLDMAGIEPAFIEEHAHLSDYKFIETDLREVMMPDFVKLSDRGKCLKVGAIHCGSFAPFYTFDGKKVLDVLQIVSESMRESR